MPQYQTYASLGDLISLDDIPESLYFLHDGLSSFFDNIYYQNFVLVRSADGASFSLTIDILLGKNLGVDIPGTGGFRLLFNPDPTPGSNISVLPLDFYFSLGILKYLKFFNPSTFTFTPVSIFNLVFKIFNINGAQLLGALATDFIDDPDPLTAFVNQVNTDYGTGISLPLDPDWDTALNQVVQALISSGLSLKTIVFNDYLLGLVLDPDAFFNNISRLLSSFLAVDLKAEVKKLIIPYLYAALQLKLGLEIPRSVLLPMKPVSGKYEVDEDVNIKSTLIFTAGSVFFDSRIGQIGFDDNFTLSFKAPHDKAQITNTPLTIHFTEARYQMVRNSGTGSTSAYTSIITVDEIEVGLPAIFEGNSGNPAIVGRNIVINSDTGFSGTIGIEGNGNLQYTFANGLAIALNSFSVTFVEGNITGSAIKGSITIPSFQQNPLNIEIDIHNGFLIKVLVPLGNGIQIINNDNVLITLDGLTIGEQASVWKLGFAASFLMKRDIPLLSKIFPQQIKIANFLYASDGSELEYDFEIDWAGGTQISGNDQSGISAIFPIKLNIGNGLFKIDGLQLNVKTGQDHTINFEILLQGVGFAIGPVKGGVDGFGAGVKIEKVEGHGNLGTFNAGLSLIGPKGVTVVIDSGAVKGGGFLYIGDHEYLGAISLSFKDKISINAVGILTTKLPGGIDGYSLLVIITAEFTPIQLGMGFTLNGVGGLLGLHRTMDPDVLRTGIRDNTLDNILFPDNILDNALSIISNIGKAFPIKKGQFVVGPMAKLGWGTPTLITIELGVIIELPDPVRLAILGVVKAILPTKESAILKIQINFLGIIDFDNKYLSFDASLYDSKILTFGLFGDMALRLYWGDKPNFLMSVGGFHPKFTPPPLNLPQLRRLSIVLADQSNLKISVETYFAITSNSVQFGAKVAAMAKAWKIQAIGALWFDILFQFSPFHFIADMGVMFAIKMGSKTILSIYVDMTLEGPDPWRAQGKASFKILFVKVKVSFDKTFGQARPSAIAAAAVDPKFTEAVQNRDNWEALMPDRNKQLVSWKTIEGNPTDLIVDPAGRLRFSQRLLPLGVEMSKFGNAAISDYKKYVISGATSGGSFQISTLQDYYARNEFFSMSDDDKLSKPSYELFNSGIVAGTDDISSLYAVHKVCDYDEITLDAGYRKRSLIKFVLSSNMFRVHAFGNYISRSGLSAFDTVTTATGPSRIALNSSPDDFVLMNRNDMSLALAQGFSNSADAERVLADNLNSQPAVAANWIIANRFELV